MKNDHFLILCHEGQLDLPVSNKKWSLVRQISNNSEMKSAKTWKKSKAMCWRNNFWITIKDHSKSFPPWEQMLYSFFLWRAMARCHNFKSTKPARRGRPPWTVRRLREKTGRETKNGHFLKMFQNSHFLKMFQNSHFLKLFPYLINNIQLELSAIWTIFVITLMWGMSVGNQNVPALLYPCPTILLGLAACRAALA